MPLSLFDPRTQTLQPFSAGPLPRPLCGPTDGPSPGLGTLRQAVIDDLLRRLSGETPAPATDSDGEDLPTLAAREARALGETYAPSTLRHWALTVHYREPLRLEGDAGVTPARYLALDESERSVGYLAATKQRLATLPEARILPVQSAPADALIALPDALEQALEQDLDTPAALSAVASFLAAVNALCDAALRKQGRVNASAVDAARAGLRTVETALGLGTEPPGPLLARLRNLRARRQGVDVAAIDAAVAKRAAARASKDFATADALQSELLEQGITLLDGPSGTTWTFV